MIAFAVQIKGITAEGQARWVLAIDPVGDRLLVSYDDRTLHWHPFDECAFARMADPTAVQPVVVVKPATGNGIVVPGPNGGV